MTGSKRPNSKSALPPTWRQRPKAERELSTSFATGIFRDSAIGASPFRFTFRWRPKATHELGLISRFVTINRRRSTKASYRCDCPSWTITNPARILPGFWRARETGASSRKTGSGSRARRTPCRSGLAPAGTTCDSWIHTTPRRCAHPSSRKDGSPSTSTWAALNMPSCTSCTPAFGTKCSMMRASSPPRSLSRSSFTKG